MASFPSGCRSRVPATAGQSINEPQVDRASSLQHARQRLVAWVVVVLAEQVEDAELERGVRQRAAVGERDVGGRIRIHPLKRARVVRSVACPATPDEVNAQCGCQLVGPLALDADHALICGDVGDLQLADRRAARVEQWISGEVGGAELDGQRMGVVRPDVETGSLIGSGRL